MRKVSEQYEPCKDRPTRGEQLCVRILILVFFCALISLMALTTGCASSTPVVKTRTVYVTAPLDMVKDVRLPAYTGQSGDDLMRLQEKIVQTVEQHNIGQEALREVIREHQAKAGER